jgi:hypothetical protein
MIGVGEGSPPPASTFELPVGPGPLSGWATTWLGGVASVAEDVDASGAGTHRSL